MPVLAAIKSRFGLTLALALAWATPVAAQATSDLASATAFRVCSDPANMPFSNEAGEGFENKIAELLASKLGVPLEYFFYPQATGFVRRTLGDKRCDVVIGYAQGHELVLNTNHYYTSAYVFVTKADGPLAGVTTLTDPILKGRRLGVIAGSPPATHLARNGLIAKAKPYHLVVDRRFESPAEEMMADLQSGAIDAALMWGPIGGYFAGKSQTPLVVTPLLEEPLPPPMYFRITMGVRRGEDAWKRRLNELIRENQTEIDAILSEYGVPLLDEMGHPREQAAAKP